MFDAIPATFNEVDRLTAQVTRLRNALTEAALDLDWAAKMFGDAQRPIAQGAMVWAASEARAALAVEANEL